MEQVIRNGLPPSKHAAVRLNGRPIVALCLLLLCGAVRLGGESAADETLEYQVKAVFLLNFTKFVEWPATAFPAPRSPVEICILGDDPFGGVLDQVLAGETVNGRRVIAQRIKQVPAPKTCDVLYAGRPDKEILRYLAGAGPGVLTVGEGAAFLRGGGMIAFVLENRRVRFAINQAAAEGAGLKLSSKLLNVAKSVEK